MNVSALIGKHIDKSLIYNTRDGDGNEIIKTIEIKNRKETNIEGNCVICGEHTVNGYKFNDVFSSKFTEFPLLKNGICVCQNCTFSTNFYKYSLLANNSELKLLNIRGCFAELQKKQQAPFVFIVNKSQKKHLFYKSAVNYNADNFTVNLEEEQIFCNFDELHKMLAIVSNLQALGESKAGLLENSIRFETVKLLGYDIVKWLNSSLKTRQIQIPLHVSQKSENDKETATKIIKELLF